MSETLQVLNNIRTLRAPTREVALEALEDILEKLTVIVSERREEEKANEEANRVHLEKLSQYREMLIADGIDPSELMSTTGIVKERKQRKSRMCTPTIPVWRKPGQARDVHRVQFRPSSIQANHLKIS